MKINNKKCFSCIAKHVCGPAVTPKMTMCINFLKALKAGKTSHNKAMVQYLELVVKWLDAGKVIEPNSFGHSEANILLQEQNKDNNLQCNNMVTCNNAAFGCTNACKGYSPETVGYGIS